MDSDYYWIYVIILCFMLYYIINLHKKEGFNAVGYNSFKVPKNKIKTLYEEETILLNDTFDLNINKSNTIPDYKNTFIRYPYYSSFPYNSFIKDKILTISSELLLKLPEFKGSKFEIFGDMTEVYWKDIDTSRHIIFNIVLNNKQKAFSRKLLVYVIIDNINKYLTDSNEYIPINDLSNRDYKLKYIEVVKDLYYLSTEPSNEMVFEKENYDTLYQTKNTLFLMDPFKTSKSEMDITEKMKENFEEKLKNPSGVVPKDTEFGTCYNNSVPVFTKQACVETGGIWDTTPVDDYECPFYQSNQNYPNSFGKLSGDKCEMPRNMQIVGNKKYSYDPLYKPLCYNCKNNKIENGTLGFCCEEQKDKNMYPNLITPDYAFVGDTTLRNKYKEILLSNNLETN